MEMQKKVDNFVADLRSVVEKHYGSLPPDEIEPFGMVFRKALPQATASATPTTTTTASVTIPLDTDPADQDD